MLDHSTLLITGGTGSSGSHLVAHLLAHHPTVRVIVFSRDEFKQHQLAQRFPRRDFPQLRFVLGDVRDARRLQEVFAGVDYVVHTAALKHVTISELNPIEAIQTNILGAYNLIQAARAAGVKRVIALSTDKAAGAVSLYGASKLCADKLFLAAHHDQQPGGPVFTGVRYGNVLGSTGSVVPLFLQQRAHGRLTLTDPDMTRFSITLDGVVQWILYALEHGEGGELFVPKLPSFRLGELARAIAPDLPHEVIGMRPGEKRHEDLLTEAESALALEFSDHFRLYAAHDAHNLAAIATRTGGRPLPPDFHYDSRDNSVWLDAEKLIGEIESIREMPIVSIRKIR